MEIAPEDMLADDSRFAGLKRKEEELRVREERLLIHENMCNHRKVQMSSSDSQILTTTMEGAGKDEVISSSKSLVALMKSDPDRIRPSDVGRSKSSKAMFFGSYSGVKGCPSWAEARILNDEPSQIASSPLPTALIEPIFGKFIDAIADGNSPEHKFYDLATSLMDIAALDRVKLHRKEEKLNDELLEALNARLTHSIYKRKLFCGEPAIVFGETDGSCVVHHALICNLELKLVEDAEFQNDHYFISLCFDEKGRVLADFVARGIRPTSFLIDIYQGCLMVIRGAVLAVPSVLSTTLATVNLRGTLHGPGHVTLAKVLQALDAGMQGLASRYEEFSHSPVWALPPIARHVGQLFPNPFSIKAEREGENLQYEVEVGEPLRYSHFAFRATVKSGPPFRGESAVGKTFVIKFSRGRYGYDAHVAASAAGCAPAILAFERLPGGWFAILMEELKSSSWRPFNPAIQEDIASVTYAYKIAVEEPGFVHGDLRAVNVLIGTTEEGSADSLGEPAPQHQRVAILDWDWAGKQGEARYPLSMDTVILRAKGALPGALILPIHDIVQIGIME